MNACCYQIENALREKHQRDNDEQIGEDYGEERIDESLGEKQRDAGDSEKKAEGDRANAFEVRVGLAHPRKATQNEAARKSWQARSVWLSNETNHDIGKRLAPILSSTGASLKTT